MVHETVLDRQGATSAGAGAPYALRRLGVVMRPLPGVEMEANGVLNPGGVRGPDGEYYLFPRIVSPGNYSRVGMARVIMDAHGIPCDVERLGVALEPEAPYERNTLTGGGCEDPRVMRVPALDAYLMTYVAYGPLGPRAALAWSRDLANWTRLGLIDFAPLEGADMNAYGNKDALIFPEPVPDPHGNPALALIHRPMYETWDHGASDAAQLISPPPGVHDRRWTMWISFCPLEELVLGASNVVPPRFRDHQVLITPEHIWESVRLGGGTPPVRLPQGWFTIYHGICMATKANGSPGLQYNAAALLLDPADPRRVLYRSPEPILAPELAEERAGIVSNVVFPTAVDSHETYLDVYYGMADSCIGVARMDIPS